MAKQIINIVGKVSDMFHADLTDGREYSGYVPKELGVGDQYGDYIELEIDLETGQIQNWKKPSDDDLDEIFGKKP